MAAVGGPFKSIHIAGRNFVVAHDAGMGRDLGGDTNSVEMNGDGLSGRLIKEKRAWKYDGIQIQIDDDQNDQQFLQDVADANDFSDITGTRVDDTVYGGKGTITGEIKLDEQKALAEITLEGPGRLQKQ